jgi:hypothetical protein
MESPGDQTAGAFNRSVMSIKTRIERSRGIVASRVVGDAILYRMI